MKINNIISEDNKDLLKIIIFTTFLFMTIFYLSNGDFQEYFPISVILSLFNRVVCIGLCVYFWGVLCSLPFRKEGYVRIWMIIFPIFIIFGFVLLCVDSLNTDFAHSIPSLFDVYTTWTSFGYINYSQYTLYSLFVSILIAYLLKRKGEYVSKYLVVVVIIITIFVISCPIKYYNHNKVGYAYEIPQYDLFVRSKVEEGALNVEISKTSSYDNPLLLIDDDEHNDYVVIEFFDDNKFFCKNKECLHSTGNFISLDSSPNRLALCEIHIIEKTWISVCSNKPYRSSVRLRRIK